MSVGLSWIFFFVGLLTSITGVFLLSKRKSNEQPEKKFKIGHKKKGGFEKVSQLQLDSESDDASSPLKVCGVIGN